MLFESIVEYCGKETYSHCDRVGEYTDLFLQEDNLGYDKEMIECIVKGARYHDIGKSLINKKILYKADGLTEEEFAIIKEHSRLGYQIIEKYSDILTEKEHKVCGDIVLLHHRKIDGSGYPEYDKPIPLYVQLVSLFDVFDALTSPRCYQTPISYKAALAKIENGECGKFDEDLFRKVEHFICDTLQGVVQIYKEKLL